MTTEVFTSWYKIVTMFFSVCWGFKEMLLCGVREWSEGNISIDYFFAMGWDDVTAD
jgi:hypothetical protein